ncbi:DUF4157 domain-containing protein [Streptomyces sp. NPDC056663]|uniref:eCIS core domain-containing protein n=1 Tax=Streptomyces sp. NPDC056663 TaxID=3345899 RepID=UPI003697B9ED
MDIQQMAGNTAMASMVEQQRHQHGPGCEHAEPTVQRRHAGHSHGHDAEDTDHGSLIDAAMASSSSSLPGPLLTEATAFYRNPNLSQSRLHSSAIAQRATAALGAEAMTIGNHIFLGPSAVSNPGKVLKHELSHVDKNVRGITETGKDNGNGARVTDPKQSSERAAEADQASFEAGEPIAPSVVALGEVTQEGDGA